VPHGESYADFVNALKDIKTLLYPTENDYDFTKRLIEFSVEERYNYLKQEAEAFKEYYSDKDPVIIKLNGNLELLGLV